MYTHIQRRCQKVRFQDIQMISEDLLVKGKHIRIAPIDLHPQILPRFQKIHTCPRLRFQDIQDFFVDILKSYSPTPGILQHPTPLLIHFF